MVNIEMIAEELYATYCKAVGGKAHNGLPLPSWQEFSNDSAKKVQADGWRAVAERALQLLQS